MAAHDPKEGAREKAGWGLPVPAPAGARATEQVIDELFTAPKGGATDADPVASLFQDSRALPAPAIADVQSEAEVTRWRAAGRASLFDESVPDPVPSAGNTSPSASARNPANALSVPPPVPPGARKAAQAQAMASPPPVPVSVAPVSLSMAPLERVPSAPTAEAPNRKRRIERGPKKGLLAALGAAAVLSLGSAAAVLRMIPSPLAESPRPTAIAAALPHAPAAPVPVPAPAAPPMAVPVHGFKPSPVPAPTPAAAVDAAPGAVAVAAEAVPAVPAAAAAKLEAAKPQAAPAAAPLARAEAHAPAVQIDAAETSASGEQNQRLISAANKKLAEDDPQGAEALMREALTIDPGDHHAMEVLVRALIDQDRGADAVPFARRMVKRRSKRVPYRLLLGDALLMTGDENGARREWKAALDLEPNDRQVRMRLGL